MTKGETSHKAEVVVTMVHELKLLSLYFTGVEAVVLCRLGPLIDFTAGDVLPKGIWHWRQEMDGGEGGGGQ